MKHIHAVAWIDHNEAHILHFNADESEQLTVHSKHRKGHLHHKSGQVGDGRSAQDRPFYQAALDALMVQRKYSSSARPTRSPSWRNHTNTMPAISPRASWGWKPSTTRAMGKF